MNSIMLETPPSHLEISIRKQSLAQKSCSAARGYLRVRVIEGSGRGRGLGGGWGGGGGGGGGGAREELEPCREIKRP
jgi:hypothetical protein